MIIGLAVAIAVVIYDQFSKYLILDYLMEQGHKVEITSFFNLVSAWNTGVSFSMFDDLGNLGVYILSAFSLIVVAFLLFWMKKECSLYMRIALGFVIGGAIGNVIDRIRVGAVYDFLDIHIGQYHWPAFNVADSFICVGAILIVFEGLFCKYIKKGE